MSYDSWKTEPPDERAYCPYCLAPDEDNHADCTGWFCVHCGARYDSPIGYDAMVSEAREEARLHRAGL